MSKGHKIPLGVDYGRKYTKAAVIIGNKVYNVQSLLSKYTKMEMAQKMSENENGGKNEMKIEKKEEKKDNDRAIIEFARKEAEKLEEHFLLPDDLFKDCNENEWQKLNPQEKQSRIKRILETIHQFMKKMFPNGPEKPDKISKTGKHNAVALYEKYEKQKEEYPTSPTSTSEPSTSPATSNSNMNIDDLIASIRAKSTEIFKLPNVVAFKDQNTFVGQEALDLKDVSKENVIVDVRDLLGKNFKDAAVIQFLKTHLLKIEIKNDKPVIMVNFNSTRRPFYAEDIISMILLKMRLFASTYLPQTAVKVCFTSVISVPVYFNDKERDLMKEAARVAKLEPTGVVNECSAAVLAYLHQNMVTKGDTVLVLNMAQNTTCVSIVHVNDKGATSTLSYMEDVNFGGDDVTGALLEHLKEIVYEQTQLHIDNYKPAMSRLMEAAENAKCALSSETQTVISLEDIKDNRDFEYQLSRSTFESICRETFGKVKHLCKFCISKSGLPNTIIKNAVLVGGSSRIPYLSTMLREVIPNVTVLSSIDQDEVICYGAAVQAAINSRYLTL